MKDIETNENLNTNSIQQEQKIVKVKNDVFSEIKNTAIQKIKANLKNQNTQVENESNFNLFGNDKELHLFKTTTNKINIIKNEEQINIEKNQDKIKTNYSKERIEISYEKNEIVLISDKLCSDVINKKEKIQPYKYSLLNIDDPDLFDEVIKCAKAKCILFGIITCCMNTFRLIYLIFLHLVYPYILWAVRCFCAVSCFCILCCEKEEISIEKESKKEMINSRGTGFNYACGLCKNCVESFKNFILNLVKCPCWFYEFVLDCLYDIKNRSIDNARNGCYRYIHYDCHIYENFIEDPFNDYMKKRNIILKEDPNDPYVLYGDACQNNIKF